ncbi:phosphoribosylamine--glycine ligase [Elioraea tepidiphila]|uniref:phosphoribosylamine--glycine ligase n=2 Tax=Elioraea tepidiphila TaxID=457934 RepID=UPI0003625DE2|nr:phosphoribosylamine--glycine ligase [Elioraea tepidiphila]
MKVLLVGSGGREHALAWAIAASPLVERLWCAPGNPGIAQEATCVPIGATDIPALVAFARENAVDLVVPGPEAPLVAGLADACAEAGIACFGPSAAAARLEGSKAFMKEVCAAAGVPTAPSATFTDAEAAKAHVRREGAPIVVKADGLAAGKGVVVAATVAEAEAAIDAFMRDRVHGEAGAAVVIEACLVGEEVSFFALCDGAHAVPFGAAQDHKRVGEGDTGPNTGGMGAYAPPPAFTPELERQVMAAIVQPTLAEMVRRGAPFRGVLFCGLMLTEAGPRLLEFNVRFGDPECQVLMLRLMSDLVPAMQAACDGVLDRFAVRFEPVSAIAVVMAARGYPGTPVTGSEIRGLDRAAAVPKVRVFHAGTRAEGGRIVAAGGRVLNICATGTTLAEARDAAYAAIDAIDWPEGFCRRDIGHRAFGR